MRPAQKARDNLQAPRYLPYAPGASMRPAQKARDNRHRVHEVFGLCSASMRPAQKARDNPPGQGGNGIGGGRFNEARAKSTG